mmetsp:Transcript_24701/g.57382  ORF Transcript_24701/g.57382 Transcript_24701/m.57382 type:complete len:188 (+) Transcript_24701:99-662(+)
MGKGFKQDPSLLPKMCQYQIVGRAAPTHKNPTPKIYRMRLFAKNSVMAKSRFWYFMKKMCKAKKSGGELLAVNEIKDKKPHQVKNYGIWLRYESRTNTHNMYKEYRDVNINNAVGKMYQEMSGRHRANPGSIQIINTAVLKDEQCRRDHTLEMHEKGLKFPVVRKLPMVLKKYRTTYKATRPNTFVM